MTEQARRIAQRYIDENPVCPLKLRPFYDGAVRRGRDYRYHADFNEIFPKAKIGDRAYVRCIYRADADGEIGLSLTLFGEAELSLDGETLFKSDIFTERNNHIDNRINLKVKKGDNLLELTFTKTALGFGGIFGTWLGKWDYIFFMPNAPELEGCQYRLGDGEWLPKLEERNELCLGENEYALFYAKTKDGRDVLVRGRAFPDDGELVNPCGTENYGAWLGLYPLKKDYDFPPPLTDITENTYWRFKYKGLWLRLYYGEGNFGRWSYPLGVTLYGLLKIGTLLSGNDITDYVSAHIKRCTDTLDYALWDKEKHGGAASLHNLLCSIDSLDDCGAFGAAVEEARLSLGQKDTERVCDYVAGYISRIQPRLGNGAFFRKNQLHSFHNDTMWLDDLYMSVPFLCRRYKLTGDEKCLRDAANQFVRYKKMLYMEDKGLMSHVYDLRHGLRNGIAWGRGNGWTIFSLSELLGVMPKNHDLRQPLENFFKELCKSYAALQDADGRWHQVLNEADSYLETSCTAMFACAFARGFRAGLLGDEYAVGAKKAVNSILRNCVDGDGNVYGVCRGSEFAFRSDYYKYELLPRKNDTHGTGIVLLSIYEVILCDLMKQEALTFPPQENTAVCGLAI